MEVPASARLSLRRTPAAALVAGTMAVALAGVACGGAVAPPGGAEGAAPWTFVGALAAADWADRLPAGTRYDAGEVVERWQTAGGGFAVHFSRQGRNRALPTDNDGDGLPDLVRVVGDTLDAALAVYRDRLGLRAPLAAADGSRSALDVFLVDFARRGDGQFVEEGCRTEVPRACAGLLLIENDFTSYGYPSATLAARTVASHELFHAVQAAYDRPPHVVLSEGTATWGSEAFDPTLTDFESALRGYLSIPDQPLGLAPSGPVPAFAYGSALFFRYLSERYGEGIVAALYEALERPAAEQAAGTPSAVDWLAVLARVLEQRHAVGFAEAFAEFARYCAVSGGGGPAPGFAGGAAYPPVKSTELSYPSVEPLRLFATSAQHFQIPAPPGAPLRFTLGSAPAEAVLELAAFAQVGSQRIELGRAPRTLTVMPPEGSDRLHLVVSYGAAAGATVRPSLCLGESALPACQPPASPPPPPGPGAESGGGCQAAPAGASPGAATSALLGLIALLAARRRARG